MRAFQITGDPWEEDPGCYLSDAELGLAEAERRVVLTPYRKRAHAARLALGPPTHHVEVRAAAVLLLLCRRTEVGFGR